MEPKEDQATPVPFVPVCNSLTDIYDDLGGKIDSKHKPRYKMIYDAFVQTYGQAPAYFVRAPGRFNFIGCHGDCQRYSVLPAAIEQDFVMAYSVNDSDEIQVGNIDERFALAKFKTDPRQEVSYGDLLENQTWCRYFICGYKAIMSLDEQIAQQVGTPKGINIIIGSHVPIAAGLSSSSAFTVCASIVAMHANGLTEKIPQDILADLTIRGEQMAGTACGGMDQTISIMGEKGAAKLIDFVPHIKATKVGMPQHIVVVVANTCTPCVKLKTLGTQFNKRVVECRLATCAMAHKAGVTDSFDSCQIKTINELQIALGYSHDQMLELLEKTLVNEEMTFDDMCKKFDSKDPFLKASDILYHELVREQNRTLNPYRRAYHILTEIKRVYKVAELCRDDSLDDEQTAVKVGEVLNQSFASSQNNYENSSDNLDELVALARESGSLGTRITGAGWGGACVSLVRKTQLDEFLDKLKTYYEKEREPEKKLVMTEPLSTYLFATAPSQGACIFDIKDWQWLN